MRKAAIYARVSTGEQTPENQLIRLREVAARAGWAIMSRRHPVPSAPARRWTR